MTPKKIFEGSYEINDGYPGRSRPQRFTIDASEVEGLSEEELKLLFWEIIQEDFNQNISPYSQDEEAFIQWAKGLGDGDD